MTEKNGSTELGEKLTQKEAEVKELKEKLEKADGRVENAQAKIHDFEGEIGDSHKAVIEDSRVIKDLGQELVDANKERKNLEASVEKLQEEINEIKESGPGSKEREIQTPPEKTLEELEVESQEDEQIKAVVDEAWKDLNEKAAKGDKEAKAQLAKYNDDKTERRKFLVKAKEIAIARRSSDRSSFWNTPAPTDSSKKEDELNRVFKIKKESA